MKFRTIDLLFSLLLACSLLQTIASAQSGDEQKKEEPKSVACGKCSSRLFEIKHRNPDSLRNALGALGSGAPGTAIVSNHDLHTLTVRDFPERLAAIEDALRRLDVPEQPQQPPISLEVQLHLLSASMAAKTVAEVAGTDSIPKSLEPVITQLKSTLKFTHYRYVGSTLNRVSNYGDLKFSGLTGSFFPTPSGVTNNPDTPAFYDCAMYGVRLTQDVSVYIKSFQFGVKIPIRLSSGPQYQNIGINTPLNLREGETAVVGTANISSSDEAIIVVVSVRKLR